MLRHEHGGWEIHRKFVNEHLSENRWARLSPIANRFHTILLSEMCVMVRICDLRTTLEKIIIWKEHNLIKKMLLEFYQHQNKHSFGIKLFEISTFLSYLKRKLSFKALEIYFLFIRRIVGINYSGRSSEQ